MWTTTSGDFRGRALLKKNGQLRSEGQMRVNGYETVEVFVESVEVVISNVVSKSTQPRGGRPDAYEAAPIRIGEPYYVDSA